MEPFVTILFLIFDSAVVNMQEKFDIAVVHSIPKFEAN